jgi:hypothetical protein
MLIFLGSAFYHSKMIELFKGKDDLDNINLIYKTLYNFSNKLLIKLFEYDVFRSLLRYFASQFQSNNDEIIKKLAKNDN